MFALLADYEAANGVLVLDEVDKMVGDLRYPTESALLELLEPQSAVRFRDQALDIEFDASKLIVIGTANDARALSAPIASRFEILEVDAPDRDGRERIVRRLWLRLREGVRAEVHLSEQALRQASDSTLSPREIRRVLRASLGRALRQGETVVSTLAMPRRPERRVGF